MCICFFFSSRRRHTRCSRDWSSDVCSSDLKLVRKREGMGMGDVKMMAMVGAFVGLRGTFWTILLGSLLGSAIGLSVVVTLYLAGWHRELAERGSRRGLGAVNTLRWTIASQYQLPQRKIGRAHV